MSRAASQRAPGAYQPLRDTWGRFPARALDAGDCLIVVDRRVLQLHLHVARWVRGHAHVELQAGERAKSGERLEQVLAAGVSLPRSGTLIAIGGGTIGDLATVAAHLLKRGVRLIHVPTTLLAAVDSSVGGKGAVHVGAAAHVVKNAAGVFHYPAECWICPELFTTLRAAQRREGALEAWKMALCLDAGAWRRWSARPPAPVPLIREARRLKSRVCAEDPYERTGQRALLNFGHTFGHVIESLGDFRVPHGLAVGSGMLGALDIGRALGVTPEPVAEDVERVLCAVAGCPDRRALRAAFAGATAGDVRTLLGADKKRGAGGAVTMVLLRRIGSAVLRPVPDDVWRGALRAWSQ